MDRQDEAAAEAALSNRLPVVTEYTLDAEDTDNPTRAVEPLRDALVSSLKYIMR
jgi:hypothetical protein